jgi:hypothetical protein
MLPSCHIISKGDLKNCLGRIKLYNTNEAKLDFIQRLGRKSPRTKEARIIILVMTRICDLDSTCRAQLPAEEFGNYGNAFFASDKEGFF